MNVDGSGEVNISNNVGNDVFPAWSAVVPNYPQGRIAFRSSRTGNSEIYVISPLSLSVRRRWRNLAGKHRDLADKVAVGTLPYSLPLLAWLHALDEEHAVDMLVFVLLLSESTLPSESRAARARPPRHRQVHRQVLHRHPSPASTRTSVQLSPPRFDAPR